MNDGHHESCRQFSSSKQGLTVAWTHRYEKFHPIAHTLFCRSSLFLFFLRKRIVTLSFYTWYEPHELWFWPCLTPHHQCYAIHFYLSLSLYFYVLLEIAWGFSTTKKKKIGTLSFVFQGANISRGETGDQSQGQIKNRCVPSNSLSLLKHNTLHTTNNSNNNSRFWMLGPEILGQSPIQYWLWQISLLW